MRWIAVFFFLIPVSSLTNQGSASAPNDFHICFFELHNTKASDNLKKHEDFKKLKGAQVHTFTPGSSNNISKGFKAMIEETSKAGKRCDSLVISGHHTGNWYGDFGGLKLKELEELSCDPNYKDWFKNIKALWLDGCNTVTDNLVTGSKPPTPDSEAARVIEKETEQTAEIPKEDFRSLNQAYTLSLDKNTPLSSRYLRAFPNTQIYGFNEAVPEGDQVQKSYIAEHLKLLGTALKEEKRYLGYQKEVSEMKLGVTALFADFCNKDRMEAWYEINKNQGEKPEAIENLSYRDEQALACALISVKQILDDSKSSKEKVKQAKELLNKVLNYIIEQDKELKKDNNKLSLSHLLFNNIYETWATAKKYKTSDPDFFKSIQTKLKSDHFKTSLQERIESPQTSSTRRADYIKFYMEIEDMEANEKPVFIENTITELADKSAKLFPDLESPSLTGGKSSERTRRYLAHSTIDQLLQYNLLSEDQKEKLLKNEANTKKEVLFPTNISSFGESIHLKLRLSTKKEREKMLDKIQNENTPGKDKKKYLTDLTNYFLQNDSQDEITEFKKMNNSVTSDERKTIREEMHYTLLAKSREERIDIMAKLINDASDNATNTRELVADWGMANLQDDEKKELCDKIRIKSRICPQ